MELLFLGDFDVIFKGFEIILLMDRLFIVIRHIRGCSTMEYHQGRTSPLDMIRLVLAVGLPVILKFHGM